MWAFHLTIILRILDEPDKQNGQRNYKKVTFRL
jgi:hypothetical protein